MRFDITQLVQQMGISATNNGAQLVRLEEEREKAAEESTFALNQFYQGLHENNFLQLVMQSMEYSLLSTTNSRSEITEYYRQATKFIHSCIFSNQTMQSDFIVHGHWPLSHIIQQPALRFLKTKASLIAIVLQIMYVYITDDTGVTLYSLDENAICSVAKDLEEIAKVHVRDSVIMHKIFKIMMHTSAEIFATGIKPQYDMILSNVCEALVSLHHGFLFHSSQVHARLIITARFEETTPFEDCTDGIEILLGVYKLLEHIKSIDERMDLVKSIFASVRLQVGNDANVAIGEAAATFLVESSIPSMIDEYHGYEI